MNKNEQEYKKGVYSGRVLAYMYVIIAHIITGGGLLFYLAIALLVIESLWQLYQVVSDD